MLTLAFDSLFWAWMLIFGAALGVLVVVGFHTICQWIIRMREIAREEAIQKLVKSRVYGAIAHVQFMVDEQYKTIFHVVMDDHAHERLLNAHHNIEIELKEIQDEIKACGAQDWHMVSIKLDRLKARCRNFGNMIRDLARFYWSSFTEGPKLLERVTERYDYCLSEMAGDRVFDAHLAEADLKIVQAKRLIEIRPFEWPAAMWLLQEANHRIEEALRARNRHRFHD